MSTEDLERRDAVDARDEARVTLVRDFGGTSGEVPDGWGEGAEGVDEGAGESEEEDSRVHWRKSCWREDGRGTEDRMPGAVVGEAGSDVEVGRLESEVDAGTTGGSDGCSDEGSELGSATFNMAIR